MKALTDASNAASRSSALKAGISASVAGIGEGVECPKLRRVLVADRAQQPFGLGQGIAQDEGVKGEPKSGGLGILKSGAPQRAVDHFARGMVGRPRRVEAEVQVEQARMAMGKIAIGGGDVAQIGAPVGAGQRQLDGGQRPVGDPPQQLVLRAEMVQHRHRVDADLQAEFAHGKPNLAIARQHVECGIEDGVLVEAAASARAGNGSFPCCLR